MLKARRLLYQLPDQLSSSCEGSVRRKSIAITEHCISYSGGKRRLSTLYFVSSGTLGWSYALDCVEYYVLLPVLVLVTLLLLVCWFWICMWVVIFSVLVSNRTMHMHSYIKKKIFYYFLWDAHAHTSSQQKRKQFYLERYPLFGVLSCRDALNPEILQ